MSGRRRGPPGAVPGTAPHPAKEMAMLPIRTVLHPTDFSPQSDAAFQVACALARDYGARLVLLHVRPPAAAPGAPERGI